MAHSPDIWSNVTSIHAEKVRRTNAANRDALEAARATGHTALLLLLMMPQILSVVRLQQQGQTELEPIELPAGSDLRDCAEALTQAAQATGHELTANLNGPIITFVPGESAELAMEQWHALRR